MQPEMPEKLREIVAGADWERHASYQRPDWFEYFGLNPDEQRGGHDVVQVYWDVDTGWSYQLYPFNCGVSPETIHAASALMRRIDAALVSEGPDDAQSD